jgi:hypothetical protein
VSHLVDDHLDDSVGAPRVIGDVPFVLVASGSPPLTHAASVA